VVQVDIGVDGEKLSKELIEEVDEPSFIVRFKLGGRFFFKNFGQGEGGGVGEGITTNFLYWLISPLGKS
jgi:hypothetical protein